MAAKRKAARGGKAKKRAGRAKPQRRARGAAGGANPGLRQRGAPASPELAALVRRLEDQRAIEDTIVRYGHALDERDWAALRECFAPGARVKYGDADWLTGAEDVGRYCARVLDPLELSQHRFSSIAVRIEGDRATSKTYLAAEHVRGGQRYTVGGHYLDAWERTPRGWRIAERRLVSTWTEGDPSVLAPDALG